MVFRDLKFFNFVSIGVRIFGKMIFVNNLIYFVVFRGVNDVDVMYRFLFFVFFGLVIFVFIIVVGRSRYLEIDNYIVFLMMMFLMMLIILNVIMV